MATKLTLMVEKSIIERGKFYAKKNRKSLTEVVDNNPETITKESEYEKISPKLNKIIGSVKLPKKFDDQKELRTYLQKKHVYAIKKDS